MRHRWAHRKLGRTSSHRKALLRTMVTEFLENERMITTLAKAKELRPVAEKMITLGKRDSLHARRQALSYLRSKGAVHKLFDSLAPRFADRHGGYTRIIKLGPRRGDAAELALLELLDEEVSPKPKKKKKKAAKPVETASKEVEPVESPETEETAESAEAEEAVESEAGEAEAVAEEPAADAAATEETEAKKAGAKSEEAEEAKAGKDESEKAAADEPAPESGDTASTS